MTNVSHDLADDQAVTRKKWALAHLDYAAAEVARQRAALDYFTARARDYDCTTSEIDAVLAANQ